MQLKDHKWIVFLFVLLICSSCCTIQKQFLDDNDYFYYNPNMVHNINTRNRLDSADDINEGQMQENSHNFFTTLDDSLPNSMLFPFKDISLAPEPSAADCAEPDKGSADTKNSSQQAEEKCADGETGSTTAAPAEECQTDEAASGKKAPLKFLMKALLPSGSTSASTTAAPDSSASTEASSAETTTAAAAAAAATTTTTAAPAASPAPEPAANPASSSSKGSVDSLPTSPATAGSGGESKAKELHQLVQHLYVAQARVQLEATEIRKAQSVANTAQQHLEEAANRVRSILSGLQTAQQEVASAAIRAQTAQLQLAAHDQLLFAARQDVDALSSQMVGLQAAEGFVQPKASFDIAALLERLKKPLTDAEKPTAVPPIVPMPKPKSKRYASNQSPPENKMEV